jgi:hypothetical protein
VFILNTPLATAHAQMAVSFCITRRIRRTCVRKTHEHNTQTKLLFGIKCKYKEWGSPSQTVYAYGYTDACGHILTYNVTTRFSVATLVYRLTGWTSFLIFTFNSEQKCCLRVMFMFFSYTSPSYTPCNTKTNSHLWMSSRQGCVQDEHFFLRSRIVV